jgi:hypothetical protein
VTGIKQRYLPVIYFTASLVSGLAPGDTMIDEWRFGKNLEGRGLT